MKFSYFFFFQMADITVDFENKKCKDLLGLGVRAYKMKNYQAAVAYLDKASELSVVEYGEKHITVGDCYLYYGKALLEVAREEGDPLGDAVPKAVDSNDEDSSDEGGEPEVANIKNAKAEGDKKNDVEEMDGVEVDESKKVEKKADDEKENVGDVEENVSEKNKSEDVSENKKDVSDNKEDSSDLKLNGKTEINVGNGTSAGTSSGENLEKTEQEEEDPSDLQVAWEVLDFARVIFTEAGDEYKPDLAETLVTLGEVSLESENFDLAIRDISQGLEVQKSLPVLNERTLAETHYKLAVAYSTNSQFDEAIGNFEKSAGLLKNKMENLKKEGKSKSEVEELEGLLPEIEERILDTKILKEEAVKKAAQAESSSAFQPSPEKKANDISHLVKRKRKLEDITEEMQNPAKKPT